MTADMTCDNGSKVEHCISNSALTNKYVQHRIYQFINFMYRYDIALIYHTEGKLIL